MKKGKLPDFRFERRAGRAGYTFIAGVDEVGRGCFAGPLVTGCVIFRSESKEVPFKVGIGILINDSKKMQPRHREKSAEWIKDNALAFGIGEVSVQKINHVGMGKAAKIAFRQAISKARKRLGHPIDFLLADAFFIPYVPGLPARGRRRQQAIVNGDEKSVSIAAASIIAKVYRDKLMQNLSRRPKYKKYGWGRNKGYGTREHQNAIKKYGTTRQHRKQFVETWLRNSSSFRAQ